MEVDHKYTADEVAKMLNVTGETVRRWCREKRLRFVKFPGKKGEYRFAEKDIRDFLARLNSEAIVDDIAIMKDEPYEKREKK